MYVSYQSMLALKYTYWCKQLFLYAMDAKGGGSMFNIEIGIVYIIIMFVLMYSILIHFACL